MNKSFVRIGLILLVLSLIFATTLYLNMEGRLDERIRSQEEMIIFIKVDGEFIGELSFENMQQLKSHEFDVIHRGGGRPPENKSFVGVELESILEFKEIDLTNREMVIVKAVDGFSSTFSIDEVKENGRMFIVYKEDGQLLGKRAYRGTGPYRLVIKDDFFAMRWVRYVMEIEVK